MDDAGWRRLRRAQGARAQKRFGASNSVDAERTKLGELEFGCAQVRRMESAERSMSG
jgi:hypothetical protein